MQPEMHEILSRIDAAIEPSLAQFRRRAPATESAIDALRAAVAPYPLPEDLTTLYRWSDGIDEDVFPGLPYGLPPVVHLIREYELTSRLADEAAERRCWPATWLPSSGDSMSQIVLDIARGSPCPLLETEWGLTARLEAPSLAAALELTIHALDSGLPLVHPEVVAVTDGGWWEAAIKSLKRRHYDWSDWPYDLHIDDGNNASWPREWRAAVGLQPAPTIRQRVSTPIGDLHHDDDHEATIEAYVWSVTRALLPEPDAEHQGSREAAPAVFHVRDASGPLDVILDDFAASGYWLYGWIRGLPTRAQLDVRLGPSVRSEILERMAPSSSPPSEAAPPVAIITASRPAVQDAARTDPVLRLGPPPDGEPG